MKNRLKELRKLHYKSQASLARDLGVSRQAVNGFESGKFDPSLEMAFKLASLFKVSIEDVFIYEAENSMQTLVKRYKMYFGFERFAQKTINVFKFSANQATREGAAQVGPEHLLAGLLADPTSTSARLLFSNGANVEIATDDHSYEYRGEPRLNQQSKKTVELSLEVVQLKGEKSIGTEHLLWGLVQLAQTDNQINTLMQRYEIDVESLNHQLSELI
ncbi:helix-turn-helix domain-containing protein [Acaryochloris sp. IP29b_bin.137]|uniref:helix-turn-helix transcriptional regulator n=1 Tax=Acaryochloris sp. IP29b_bin.137 TaxID=2969217 RepID=UPI002628E1F0|nr:helix-turn-helix domain-containing protein [Acaryochloris sp. IP29b_bin.137]